MKRLAVLTSAALVSTAAWAATEVLGTLPGEAVTVTDYYKQTVYDPSDSKIGDIEDVLIAKDGTISAFIVAVGGFLGAGEKDVAVPFKAIGSRTKDGKPYLTMNATQDELKAATGFKYDRSSTKWVPDRT